MATTGDKLYANSLNSATFYTAGGVVQELAPNCLLSTFEVETVDGTGKPTKMKNTGSTSISASENFLGKIGGSTLASSATFSRPADTTAYLARDTVSNSTSAPTILTFANILGQLNISIEKDGTSSQTTNRKLIILLPLFWY